MEFIPGELLHYCERYSEAEPPLLYELNRQTHLRTTQPRMLSGHLQGRFLSFLSHLIRPHFILEIGTFTGYSALCLAEGLAPNGTLLTIDPNAETNVLAQSFFNRSPYAAAIQLKEAQALDTIPSLTKPIDLVFIDADKKNYIAYYNAIIDKVRPGGLIIADNVLWSGKVVLPELEMDTDTRLLHAFNQQLKNDARVKSLVLPIRDGLMVVQKQ